MRGRNKQDFTVLLVEKEGESSVLVKKSLEKNPRFPSQVDHVSSISDAFKKIRNSSYHLLLVDYSLEEDSGLKFFAELRKRRVQIPFVLMTPVRDDVLVREAIRQGVADLIVKNENHFQELAGRLRKSYYNYYEGKGKASKGKNNSFQRELFQPVEDSDSKNKLSAPADELAIKDELTGLYNHSFFHDRVVNEFFRASRYGYPLSCLILNVDHFKAINEGNGYRAGDAVLKQVAAVLFDYCRLTDCVARYGGEEFAVLLPHINYEGAMELSSRLRTAFAEHRFIIGTEEIHLTVSLGISSFPDDSMTTRSELLSFASQALICSKAKGRNCVTCYRDIVPVMGGDFPELQISESKIMEFQRRMTEISNIARRAYIDASKALIMALESKDRFTAGHAASCAKYSMQVAGALGLTVDEAEIVEHAALLHDIGKVCIPDPILLKPGRLTLIEFETMKQHPYLGYKILKPIKFLSEEAILVLHHHEWFNGEGYPCRLKGEEIPMGARIISVIDSYDTMRIAGGRYKKTSTVESAVDELIACSGVQFDSRVVKGFIDVLKARGELQTENYNKQHLEELLSDVDNITDRAA